MAFYVSPMDGIACDFEGLLYVCSGYKKAQNCLRVHGLQFKFCNSLMYVINEFYLNFYPSLGTVIEHNCLTTIRTILTALLYSRIICIFPVHNRYNLAAGCKRSFILAVYLGKLHRSVLQLNKV